MASSESGPVFELREVTCISDEGRPVFQGASMECRASERVLVIAPVASGKSLLMKLLAGLSPPDQGEVLLFGRSLKDAGPDELNGLRRRLGFVFGEDVLISNLKAVENVALPLLYHHGAAYQDAMERAMALLELVGFRADPWSLPGLLHPYARKEVCLARALAAGPEAMVAESLWAGLTDTEKERYASVLLSFQAEQPQRLLVFTSATGAEAGHVKPTRVMRIEGMRFVE